ncbi:hypothetical protein [Enterobacter mori]|uniref:hypothetical protein n=1 Tax=Enterobacter mori TaxID=539813 RepID=UPI003B83ECB7
MLKTFHVTGYAVNRRGHNQGIHYTLTMLATTSADTAQTEALRWSAADDHRHTRITSVRVVSHA